MFYKSVYMALVTAAFFLSGCQSSTPVTQTGPDSTLVKEIERRMAQKKRLFELERQLATSHIGKSILRYKPIIKKYAKRYGFDWRLIAAQIVQESGFRHKARSRVGARGLMQIMPYTARELSKELDIEYILKNPRENITAGIYHLYKQYRLFPEAPRPDRTKLALASYNCGVGHVFDAQDIARYFKLSPYYWKNVRPYLTMLKKTDWQLHLQVWPTGKPKYGYFYGYNETINYVENIWALYMDYCKIL